MMFDEYADAQARADDGQPARPGDAALIAAGDERLDREHAEYLARRHDETVEEMVATNAALYAAGTRPPAGGHCRSCGIALRPDGSVENRPEEPAEHFD